MKFYHQLLIDLNPERPSMFADGQILSVLIELPARDMIMAGCYRFTFLFVKCFAVFQFQMFFFYFNNYVCNRYIQLSLGNRVDLVLPTLLAICSF